MHSYQFLLFPFYFRLLVFLHWQLPFSLPVCWLTACSLWSRWCINQPHHSIPKNVQWLSQWCLDDPEWKNPCLLSGFLSFILSPSFCLLCLPPYCSWSRSYECLPTNFCIVCSFYLTYSFLWQAIFPPSLSCFSLFQKDTPDQNTLPTC